MSQITHSLKISHLGNCTRNETVIATCELIKCKKIRPTVKEWKSSILVLINLNFLRRCSGVAKRCSACVSIASHEHRSHGKSRNIIFLLLNVSLLASFARTMTGIQEIIGGWTKPFGYQRCCRVAGEISSH